MGGSILVVDNNASIRDLLAANLGHAGFRVLCAADVREAESVLRDKRPDLAVIELMLPGTPGLTFARQLRGNARTAGICIIAVSARAEESDRVAALEGGADDFVSKPYSTRELLARIKAVIRRRSPQLADEVVHVDGLRLDPAAHQVSVDEEEVELWGTEFRLLHFFMTHPGRVFSRAKLLDEVWGEQIFVEERTVDVHIRRLRLALAPSGRSELVETVRGVGYRFRSESPTRAVSVARGLGSVLGLAAPVPAAGAL